MVDLPEKNGSKLSWQSVITNTLQIIDLKPQYFRLFTIQNMIALLDGFYSGHQRRQQEQILKPLDKSVHVRGMEPLIDQRPSKDYRRANSREIVDITAEKRQ